LSERRSCGSCRFRETLPVIGDAYEAVWPTEVHRCRWSLNSVELATEATQTCGWKPREEEETDLLRLMREARSD
jgi:hypothetical protein